jgi:uncharacterized Zn finger protein (UPF0148 family)
MEEIRRLKRKSRIIEYVKQLNQGVIICPNCQEEMLSVFQDFHSYSFCSLTDKEISKTAKKLKKERQMESQRQLHPIQQLQESKRKEEIKNLTNRYSERAKSKGAMFRGIWKHSLRRNRYADGGGG